MLIVGALNAPGGCGCGTLGRAIKRLGKSETDEIKLKHFLKQINVIEYQKFKTYFVESKLKRTK